LAATTHAQWFEKPPFHIPYVAVSNHSSVIKIYLQRILTSFLVVRVRLEGSGFVRAKSHEVDPNIICFEDFCLLFKTVEKLIFSPQLLAVFRIRIQKQRNRLGDLDPDSAKCPNSGPGFSESGPETLVI
jgi:hypothetical protein